MANRVKRVAFGITNWTRAAGKDLNHLAPDDLAPATEFHVGGKEATVALAQLAGFGPGTRVLDIGGGLGGPARTLASEFG